MSLFMSHRGAGTGHCLFIIMRNDAEHGEPAQQLLFMVPIFNK